MIQLFVLLLCISMMLPCFVQSLSLSIVNIGGRRSGGRRRMQMHDINSIPSSFLLRMTSNSNNNEAIDQETTSNNNISSQFKILTCSSTPCSKRSQAFGLDEYALFSGLYQRREEADEYLDASQVVIEESSCLGCCKVGPCIGIEHEDYYGTVALEGMKPNEFKDRVFQNIVTEEDLDRVWSSVENSIRVMMEQEEE